MCFILYMYAVNKLQFVIISLVSLLLLHSVLPCQNFIPCFRSNERLIPTHILFNTHTVYVHTYVQTILHIDNTIQMYWSCFSLGEDRAVDTIQCSHFLRRHTINIEVIP